MLKRLLSSLAGEAGEATARAWAEAATARGETPSPEGVALAGLLAFAYPALKAQIFSRPEEVVALSRERLRIARDLRGYRRLAVATIPVGDADEVRRGLRLFAQRERLRIAARELLGKGGADVDVTAREIADLAQVSIEVALDEAMRWARARWGEPSCGIVVLGMGKLGGRELNVGSDVDLLPFYETDDGEVRPPGGGEGPSLHEFYTRVVQRFTATLEESTADGIAWRVDLRLRPEGARGPLVNALAAAERYYETWGRTWERAALVRARPVAGDLVLGERILEALSPFVWRRVVDPKIAHDMTTLVQRARLELSKEPERDLKLGTGGIREAEFFVQSLQLIWGGREPRIRHANTLEALRRLRSRGLVTDREGRELESAYLTLRRVEHRIQLATGIQTHALPRGEILETIARTLGHESSHDLERDLDKTRRKVAARFASLTREIEPEGSSALEPLFAALEEDSEALVVTALAEGAAGPDLAAAVTPDLARHLLALARRPDHPLGASTRDRHPDLAPELLAAIGGAADPEQATRLLVSFFARFASPGAYARALAANRQALRRLVTLLGASAFLGQTLAAHPELVDTALFAKGVRSAESATRDVELEVEAARKRRADEPEADDEDLFVGALRRAKLRAVVEVGVSELSGELPTRDAALVLTAIADATLEQATRFALAEKGLEGGLGVIAMGKLGGRELGYGSDLDIFFVYDEREDDETGRTEKYVRAAQRVLRLVSTPHGEGPGYELDTRLRPSGSHGLLVVSVDAFARYHGLTRDGALVGGEAAADEWERQALVRARACAGDRVVGARIEALAAKAAYELGAPDAGRVHHLRLRMERELAREGPGRFDVKLGHGGLVDVEFAVQCLQMKYGADPRVRTQDTGAALGALEACGHLDATTATVFRDGYLFLRRLEQALRVVHGPARGTIEEGAPGMPALARRMGFRDGPHATATEALFAQYRAVTRDVRAAYLSVLGEPVDPGVPSSRGLSVP